MKICKRESAKWQDVQIKFVCIFIMAYPMSCFCHHSHQSACSERVDGWLTPGLQWTATPFVSERKILQNWCQNDHSASFSLSHCVFGVSKVVILNFISCGLILEVQDNPKCKNSSFSHFNMFWLITFYIHFSQFVWCSCTQFKINACLKRYLSAFMWLCFYLSMKQE